MPPIASIPQTRQQVVDMRARLQRLHDDPTSGIDTRKSMVQNIKHCDFLLEEIDAGALLAGAASVA